jgi:hypothetical protein
MAAEFSRELGVKVYEGEKRLVKLGFWVGAKAGYGYRPHDAVSGWVLTGSLSIRSNKAADL